MSDDGRILIASMFGTVAGVIFFFKGLKDLRLRRLIQNTPTSKIRSMAMGLVEIKGKAKFAEEKLISPISKKECVFYEYIVEEYRSSGKSGRWVKIAGNKSENKFYIEDNTGKALINPKNITANYNYDIKTNGSRQLPEKVKTYLEKKGYKVNGIFRKSYRCREIYVEEGDNLYVLAKTKKLNNGEIIISGEDCTFSYMSDHVEKELIKKLLGQIILKVYGGAALTVICIAVILAYFRVL